MRITKISILNFLGIGAFKTDRLGKLNRITGKNKTGKSAVLKAITEAFKSSGVDPHIIKVDEDKAEIMIELDEKVLIERSITPSANTVKVVVDGQPLNKPQTWLNGLIGPLNFNPVDFYLSKPKDRRTILLSAMPFRLNAEALRKELNWTPELFQKSFLDLTKLDYSKHGLEILAEIQKAVYDRRHEQGLEVTRLNKSIEQDKIDIPPTFNAKQFEKFNLQTHIDKLTEYNKQISQNEHDKQTLDSMRTRAEQIVDEMEKLQKELDAIQRKGVELKGNIISFIRPDIESLQTTIQQYQQSQKLINKLEAIQEKESELEQANRIHKDLDEFYQQIVTDIPRKLLSQIELPIDGLEIKGDDVFVSGVSIEKFSSSEMIEFALKIARALAKELKVICVDRFECLDTESRRIFEEQASKDDFEYFVTIVTDGKLNLETENPEQQLMPEKSSAKNKAGF